MASPFHFALFVSAWTLAWLIFIQGSSRALLLKNNNKEKDRNYQLYEMRPVSESGRYLNQTEMDFETLLPSCTCLSSTSTLKDDNCSSQCCYCQMGCPFPEHPFTNELFLPQDITCLNNVTTTQEMQGRSKSRAIIPWFCDRMGDFHGQGSTFFNLVCVQGLSLNYYKHFFDINPAWTREGITSGGWHLPTKYNWRERRISQFNTGNGTIESGDLLMSKSLEPIVSKGMVNETIGNINFTKQEDSSSKFRLYHVLYPIQFNISAPKPCSQLSEGGSLEECTYLISLQDGDSRQLREAVLVTARVFSVILTNATEMEVRILNDDDESNDTEVENDYESIPVHGVITKVQYRSSVVAIYVRFDRYVHNVNAAEFPVRLSYNRVYISEQYFANLPRFWNEIVYGKCPEQFCWRDVGNSIGPVDDVFRLTNLDTILLRNSVYIIVPLIPILTYFLVHFTLFG